MSLSSYLHNAALAEREKNKNDRPKVFGGSNWVTPATHGHLHELGRAAVEARLTEASLQLTHWSGAKARALTAEAREQAGARVTIWEGEVRAIKARLQELAAA